MNIDETYYTIQPTPNGMPRSVKELREALAALSESQLREMMLAEARSNNAFAAKVFAAHEKEILMQLNTNYDFDHLAKGVKRQIFLSVSETDAALSNWERLRIAAVVKSEIREAIETMKAKTTAEYASPGTKESSLLAACAMVKQIVLLKRDHFLAIALEVSWSQLLYFMRETLGVMGAQQLVQIVEGKRGGAVSALGCLMEVKRLCEEDGRDAGMEELIELLTTKVDDSSGTDDDADENFGQDLREDTPTTPQPGSAMSVLFMDD